MVMLDLVRYHKHVEKPEGTIVLGGAAYCVLPDGEIFIDFKSGDFGKINMSLVESCLESTGLKIITIDDKYFSKVSPEKYLAAKLPRKPKTSQDDPWH
jgi:hypothetical protein